MVDSNPSSYHAPVKEASPAQTKRALKYGGGPPDYVKHALEAVAQPYKGITTDGTVIPALFPIQKTGVFTQSVREAAEDFLGSLTPEQRAKTLFPIDTDEWR